MTEPEEGAPPARGRHRVVRERSRGRIALRVGVAVVVVAALLVLGYFLAPYVVGLLSSFKQDAPADGSPLSTISIDVRPDP